ncbi:odorant receptor [Holotrichia oblita]|uniref:Odorant receptor n=1 Tax=Holotrichia oblita TaxID=644536 RepID=A0ACB9TEQ3_HOLOL|nr:odorant receptor [Holotrichia oblita]
MMTTGVLPYLKNGRTFNEISPNITQVIVKFPYPSTLPFEVDYTASPCYELMFTFQVFSMNLYGWYFSNIDALIIGLMMHIIAQFKILVSAIENVTKRAENMAAHDVPFGSSSFTNMASFSFAITFEVFMHCIYGDEISFYSAEVGKAAYNCLCKIAVIMHQKSKIRTFYQSLESGYFLPNHERGGNEEFRIISSAIWQSNMQTYVFYTFVTVIVANRGFYAGFDKGYFIQFTSVNGSETTNKHYKVMPYTTWIPFDTNVSPYYEIAFAYQIVSALIYGLLIGTCDSFIAGFMVHIKAQLLILKNSFGNYIYAAKVKTQMSITTITNDVVDIDVSHIIKSSNETVQIVIETIR